LLIQVQLQGARALARTIGFELAQVIASSLYCFSLGMLSTICCHPPQWLALELE